MHSFHCEDLLEVTLNRVKFPEVDLGSKLHPFGDRTTSRRGTLFTHSGTCFKKRSNFLNPVLLPLIEVTIFIPGFSKAHL